MSFVSSYWESMLRYDENPQAYIISMHTMSVVSLVFFGFGAYCVIKKKKAVSSMYRKLLLLYMTINILSQICWTSLYLPHMILPYTAGNTLGFFRTVGLPPELQLTIQFTLLGALGGCTALMFFYRLWVILPPNHLYTRKYIYVTFLVSLFCMSCIVPPPLIAWACYSSPTELIKQHLIQKFGFVTEQLFDNQTLAFEMSVGSPMFITVCYFVVCIACSAWIIGWTMRSIGLALRSYTDQMTTTTKKQHRSLTHMLYVQTLVVVGCISLPFTAFAIFMWFGIPACGILHICFVIYSMADPASTAIMVYMHTPYRQTLMELLVRLGLQKQTENVAVATSTVPVTMTISTRARPYARASNNELSNSWSRPATSVNTSCLYSQEGGRPDGISPGHTVSYGQNVLPRMYHHPFTTPGWYPEGIPFPTDQPLGYTPQTLIPNQECLDETIPHDPVSSEPTMSAPTPVQDSPFYAHHMFQPFPFHFYTPYMHMMPPPEGATPLNSPYYGLSVTSSLQSRAPLPPIPPIQLLTPQSEEEKKRSGAHLRVKKFSQEIIAQLNMKYQQKSFIQGAERKQFAEFLGLKPDQVKIWFQNKRYKDRKQGKLVGIQVESLYPQPPANTENIWNKEFESK